MRYIENLLDRGKYPELILVINQQVPDLASSKLLPPVHGAFATRQSLRTPRPTLRTQLISHVVKGCGAVLELPKAMVEKRPFLGAIEGQIVGHVGMDVKRVLLARDLALLAPAGQLLSGFRKGGIGIQVKSDAVPFGYGFIRESVQPAGPSRRDQDG